MPTIAARCPKCKTVFRLKDASLAGKKIRCRKCQTPFVVPSGANGGRDDIGLAGGADPYGRDVAFTKPGVLPVQGRKIKKIEKVAEPKKPEPEEPVAPVARRKSKGKGKGKGKVKGKKKKKTETSQQQKMIAIGGGVVMLALIVVGAIFGPGMLKKIAESQKLEVPKKYLVYKPNDSELKIDYPEGWEISHGGGSDNKIYFMRIKHAGVEVFIVEYDPQKAAMNAALSGPVNSKFTTPDKDPSYDVHMRRLKEIQETNADFEESPPEQIKTGLGIAQYSTFTDPGFFGTTTGYRVTLADGHYTGYFRCSPKQLESAKPIFKHMIESIGGTKDDEDKLPGN